MVDVTMTMEEYLQLINGLISESIPIREEAMPAMAIDIAARAKRKKPTAYQRRYKANFKKIASRFKLKNGKWKKNGFKMAVKMAHKMSKK